MTGVLVRVGLTAGVLVRVEVDVEVAGAAVLVRVEVAVEVDVAVAAQELLVTTTSSTYQPVAATELSVPSLNRKRRFWFA